MKRILLIAAPVIALTVTGGAVAVAGTALPGAPQATTPLAISTDLATIPAPPAVTAPNPVTAVESAASAAIPAFNALPVSPMPASVAATSAGAQQYGRNPNLARAVTTVYGKGWVVPGRGYVCLVVPDPTGIYATSCLPTAAAAQNGLQISMGSTDPSGRVAVTTVAPTGRTAVVKTPASAAVSKLTAATPGASDVTAASDGVSSAFVSADTIVGISGQ